MLQREGTQLATSELTSNRKDKVFEAKADLKNPAGVLIASATGKYLPIKDADAAEMAREFVEDATWLWK